MNKRGGILIVSVTILVLCFAGTASATNWTVDGSGGADFTGIQEAINNASDGDTILVSSGVYYENVVVDKSVTLIGNGQPVVDAGGRESAIILTADGITLQGFKATNSVSSWGDVGIKVTPNNNTITGNNASNNNGDGISLYRSSNNIITGNNVSNNNGDGINLFFSSNNIITGNNVSNNRYGISLFDSSNNNTITGNNVSNNNEDGINLFFSSDNNTITGNNVSNNNGDGISLHDSSNNNTITGNNVSNNNWGGISLHDSSNNNTITGNVFVNDGLSVYSSYQNTVEDNTVNGKPLVYLEDVSDYKVGDAGQVILINCNNITVENLDLSNTDVGIELWKTENSRISNNTVCNNNRGGIDLSSSSNNNTIAGNVFVNDGLSVYSSYQNTVEDNTVNGKPLVYLEDVSDYKVGDAGQVILINCNNITVENLDLSNTSIGIKLWETGDSKILNNTASNNSGGGISLYYSSNNTITGNNVSNIGYGIDLSSSSNNNTITGNNVSNNNWDGISLYRSSNNKIYFNNFINNVDNVDSYKSTNIWNSPLEITYTYDGRTYKSYLGNYWDDYEGTDAEGDGIGDSSYSIDSDSDESDDYPLMKPFENYNISTSAPT